MKTIKQIVNEQSQPAIDKVMEIDDVLSSIFWEKPEDLSESEKFFIYVEILEREVNNGGFSQYFFNSSGEYAQETVLALKRIKANKTASLLENAIQQFPDSDIPSDSTKRRDTMERIVDNANDVWNELDDLFYKYEDNIAELLLDFVKNDIGNFNH